MSTAAVVAAAQVGERAWSLSIPPESVSGYEYRASCSDATSGRTYLLFASLSTGTEESRGVATARVSNDGRLEGVFPVPSTGNDAVVDAKACVVLNDGALMIIGSTRSHSLIALTDRSRQWSSIALGAGGYDAQIFDVAKLSDQRIALAGSYELEGFVQLLDVVTGETTRLAWKGRRGATLVLDVERDAHGFAICGIEGPRNEPLSSSTEWFVASFDDDGIERARAYRAGRSCRLLASKPPAAAVDAVYVDGSDPFGPLRRTTFTSELEVSSEVVALGRVAVGLFLDIAQIGDTFGVLSRTPASELVEFLSQTSGLRLATERLGYFPIGFSDLAAGEKVFLVVGRVVEGNAREPSMRVEALHVE